MKINRLIIILFLGVVFPVAAQEQGNDEVLFACMADAMKTAKPATTVQQLREQCETGDKTAVSERILLEKQASSNRFAILPHKPNYVLPVTYAETNAEPYGDLLQGREFDDIEAKFQVSLKYIAIEDFLSDNFDVEFAFTATSWWQAYNSDISAPFRETNYEPELIFNYKKPWNFFGIPVANSYISLNHQSNGQAGQLSRSWNRVIGGLAFVTGDVTWGLRTWWRLPEDEKEFPNSPEGDDNPNIERYLGYGEIGALWQIDRGHQLDILLRNNLRSDNKGALRLGWSFPLSKNLRGYVEYFNGYGESLIYYDQHIQRFGLGVKLTDWL